MLLLAQQRKQVVCRLALVFEGVDQAVSRVPGGHEAVLHQGR